MVAPPDGVRPSRPPVPVRSAADFGNKVAVQVVKVVDVTSSGTGPGQISGQPSVALTLQLRNDSATAITVDNAIVNASYAPDSTPASAVDGPPAQPFRGSVPPAGVTSGVYVFALPPEARRQVSISVSYSADQPVVVFTGSLE